MFVLKNEGGRRNFFWYMGYRSRARPCQVTGVLGFLAWQVRHGPCQGTGVLGSNFFFVFLNRARTITYKIPLNDEKQKK